MVSRRSFLKYSGLVAAGLALPRGLIHFSFRQQVGAVPFNAALLPQFVDPLPIPPILDAADGGTVEMSIEQQAIQTHSSLPGLTTVWSYRPESGDYLHPGNGVPTYLGPTFLARRGTPTSVRWFNNLPFSGDPVNQHPLPLDATLHWAGSHEAITTGIPISTHLHGGEVPSSSDGGPEAWYTPGFSQFGPAWESSPSGFTYTYPNEQQAATLWYHDHALGITRLNVYMGLAGFYIIDDPDDPPAGIPHLDDYDIGLAIQDRIFDTDGNFLYPPAAVSNGTNPLWSPEFFGDAILVNGAVWPVFEVEPRTYRFRVLNGSNARFYTLELKNQVTDVTPEVYQIGTDGGYLDSPALIRKRFTIAPGERADLIIDFSAFDGQEILLANSARTPFPKGAPVDPRTSGRVMLFRVGSSTDAPFVFDPGAVTLPASIPDIANDADETVPMTLNEVMAPNGVPLMALLNGRLWDHTVEEIGRLGETQIWEIINLTGDTHPIHLHLVQFQLVSRQNFNVNKYTTDYMAANGGMMPPFEDDHTIPDITPYLQGKPAPAPANEAGWKDTVQMHPGEVTRIAVRFARQDGQAYDFDATEGPGYVWHCHILEHEDNEMMRPLYIISS